MIQFSDYNSVMEFGNHFKNRASLKNNNCRKCIVKLVIIMGCFYLSACNNTNQQMDIPIFDLTKTYPEMEFVADEANKEYISLETTDDVLADRGFTIQQVSDKYIVGSNRSKGDIFIFDRNGKIKSFFNNKGQSGNEYLNLSSIVFDEKAQEVFVADNVTCLVYAPDGRYLRKFNYPDSARVSNLYDFDEHTLLAYCAYRARSNDAPEDINQTMPYIFLSKKDGSVISRLDLSFQKRVNSRIIIQTEQGIVPITISAGANKVKFGQEFIIADRSSDTIYMFSQDKKLIPLFVRTPSVFNEDHIIALTVEFKTDTYLFFSALSYDKNKITAQFLNNQQMTLDVLRTFAYNLHTGQLFSIPKIPSGVVAGAPKNTAVRTMEAFYLLEGLENDKLKGKLKQVAQEIDADANPVVEIIKY
jgi:hypothetical protein